MIKEIVFDLDGTLVDSMETFIEVGNEMAEKYGFQKFSQDRIKELMQLPIKKRFEELNIPVYKLPKMILDFLNSFHNYAQRVKPINGIKEIIEKLYAEGYGLSIVSSNTIQNIEAFLQMNDMPYFSHIQSSRGLFGKHNTIEKLIKKLGAKKDEVIYIGDEQRDIEACKKIGISVISVIWGFDSLELLTDSKPDYIVFKPEELIETIKAIN